MVNSRHSTNRDRKTSAIREALSVRFGPDLAFDVTRELLPKEQILGRHLRSGPEQKSQQAQEVSQEGERRSEHVRR